MLVKVYIMLQISFKEYVDNEWGWNFNIFSDFEAKPELWFGNGSSKHTQMNLWTDAKLEALILNTDHARVNEES